HGFGQPFTSLAGKWKGFHRHGTDLALDIFTQYRAGAMQSRLHRLWLEVENLGGLLDIHAFDHARDEDETKRLGKLVDRALDDMLDFALSHGLFRVGGNREGKLDDLGFNGARRQRRQFDARPLAAQPAQGLVHGDAREPGGKARVAAKTVEMGESPDVGFLDDILGLCVVAQDAAGEPVQKAIVVLDDGADRRLIAATGAGNEVVGWRLGRFRCLCLAHGAIPEHDSRDWMTDFPEGSQIFANKNGRQKPAVWLKRGSFEKSPQAGDAEVYRAWLRCLFSLRCEGEG